MLGSTEAYDFATQEQGIVVFLPVGPEYECLFLFKDRMVILRAYMSDTGPAWEGNGQAGQLIGFSR
ncbi:MAG: hypothetical protein ABGZ17_28925 [Planctomycetaceae bacterium]